ncbi:MAG: spermine synthase [Planctomycetota bacterium]
MLPFALILIGFSGIVAQLVLLRELLIVFMGNELSIGIILANWLILGAAGAYLFGKIINRVERKVEAYVIVQVIFALALPVAVYLTRDLRTITGIATGQGFGLFTILYGSFLILLPVSISNGTLFTFGSGILTTRTDTNGSGIFTTSRAAGLTYIYETIGAIVGGLAFTYIFTPYLNSFWTAIIITQLNLFAGIVLLQMKAVRHGKIKTILLYSTIGFLVIGWSFFGRMGGDIHQYSIKRQWQPFQVVDYRNSHYGNLVVTKEEGQYTFFSNGLPVITTPVPDIGYVEDFVHLPMLAHPEPKDILVLSGGAGGVINEILKHPSVNRVDYVELDPLLFDLLRKYPTPLSQSELDNPRVHIHNIDGRLFLQQTSQHYTLAVGASDLSARYSRLQLHRQPNYDMIFIGVSNPSDLRTNRLFTREFFELARKRMNSGGMLVFALPGSDSYLGEELKKLNAGILDTLRKVYKFVLVIPGSTNLFLASDSAVPSCPVGEELYNNMGKSIQIMSERLENRHLQLGYISPGYIEYRLDKKKLDWFMDNINGVTYKMNEDFLPSAVIYSIGYWNAMFAPGFQKWFRHIEKVSFGLITLIIAILTIMMSLLLRLRKGASRMAIPIALISTGFAGMVVNLMLIFAFQVVFGYVFHQIGLMVTVFMVGIAVGGLVMTVYMDRILRHFRAMVMLEATITLVVLALLGLGYLPGGIVGQVGFLLCAGMVGVVIGAEFPLAVRLYSNRAKDGNLSGAAPISGTNCGSAGLLYGADLLGGWLGGMVGGVVLLPVIGFINTIMVIVVIKIGSIIILISSQKKLPPKTGQPLADKIG